MWATDNNKVQEFMFGYLKDPLREVEQPYFHQDEVQALTKLGEKTEWEATTLFSFPHLFFFLTSCSCCFLLTNGKFHMFSPVVFSEPPLCVVDVGGRCSEIDMDSHALSLKHPLPHR